MPSFVLLMLSYCHFFTHRVSSIIGNKDFSDTECMLFHWHALYFPILLCLNCNQHITYGSRVFVLHRTTVKGKLIFSTLTSSTLFGPTTLFLNKSRSTYQKESFTPLWAHRRVEKMRILNCFLECLILTRAKL